MIVMTVSRLEHPRAAAPVADRSRDQHLAGLTAADQQLVWAIATLLMDALPAFGVAVASFLYDQLPELPRDEGLVRALEAHAEADAREVLTTLRAGMDPSAHETPVEALSHARYLRQRGVGLQTLISVYQLGFATFREMVAFELRERAADAGQLARITAAADAYSFPFVGTTMTSLAYEFDSFDGGWTPTAEDPVLTNSASVDCAHRMRETQLARGSWLPSFPEQSKARKDAERVLAEFMDTLATGVRAKELNDRLALAATTITITLADEPALSTTLMLDRSPIEIVGGERDSEARIWIASVDLQRIWSIDFHLPMAIAKGRVRIAGPVRKFLQIVPILRTAAEPDPGRM
jgi:hypothetical protein